MILNTDFFLNCKLLLRNNKPLKSKIMLHINDADIFTTPEWKYSSTRWLVDFFVLVDLMIGSASEHLLQLVLQDNFTGSQASLNIDLTSNKRERDRERDRQTH